MARSRSSLSLDGSDLIIRRPRRLLRWRNLTERISVGQVEDLRVVRMSGQPGLLIQVVIGGEGTEPPELRVFPIDERSLQGADRLARAFTAVKSPVAALLPTVGSAPTTADLSEPTEEESTDRPRRRRGQRGSGRAHDTRFESARQPRPAQPTIAPAARTQGPRPRSVRQIGRSGYERRQIWLWNEGGIIHASFAQVGGVARRLLTLSEIATLLLAEPTKSGPALLSLTATTDRRQATAIVRGWRDRSPDGNRRIVQLRAADIASRADRSAQPKAAARNRDGSIATVSGGLPGLGKRR
jgi:hypothetical protein